MRLYAPLFCILLATQAPAAETFKATSFEAVGILEPGKCPGALVFVTGTGQRFELESTISRKISGPVRIRGNIFPQISICNQFPWIQTTAIQLLPTDKNGKRSQINGLSQAHGPLQIRWALKQEDVVEVLRRIKTFQQRNSSLASISVSVPSLPILQLAISHALNSDPNLLNDIEIGVDDLNAGKGIYVPSLGRSFANLAEVQDEIDKARLF